MMLGVLKKMLAAGFAAMMLTVCAGTERMPTAEDVLDRLSCALDHFVSYRVCINYITTAETTEHGSGRKEMHSRVSE